jgi:TRAP-type uncharacterized transport system fused permease subunit
MITAALGVIALAAAAEWYYLRPNKYYESILLLIAAVCLIKPGWITDLIGLALFTTVSISQYARNKREKKFFSAGLAPEKG